MSSQHWFMFSACPLLDDARSLPEHFASSVQRLVTRPEYLCVLAGGTAFAIDSSSVERLGRVFSAPVETQTRRNEEARKKEGRQRRKSSWAGKQADFHKCKNARSVRHCDFIGK